MSSTSQPELSPGPVDNGLSGRAGGHLDSPRWQVTGGRSKPVRRVGSGARASPDARRTALSVLTPSVTPVTAVDRMGRRRSSARSYCVSITEQGSWDVPGVPEPPRDDWGDGPAAYEPGERPEPPGRPHPAAGQRRRAERARLDAALQGLHRRRQRGAPRRRLLPSGPRGHLRRDHRPLRPRRAGRPDHGRQRAAAPRRAGPDRWRPLPPHPVGQRPDRRQRRLLRRDRAREGDPAAPRRRRHPHRADGLRRPGSSSTTWSTRRRPRSTRSPTAAARRTTRRCPTSWTASSTRSRRSATARPASTACPPGSPTSTT